MQRDMELVRRILLAIEEGDGDAHLAVRRLAESSEYTEDQIGYHVLVMAEGDLLMAAPVTSQGDAVPTAIPTRMTWHGHEFLDAARNATRWATAKHRAAALGGLTLPVLLELLKDITLHELGLRQ